jgi:hypothetical protein
MSSKVYDNKRGRLIAPDGGGTIKFRVNQSWKILNGENLRVWREGMELKSKAPRDAAVKTRVVGRESVQVICNDDDQ